MGLLEERLCSTYSEIPLIYLVNVCLIHSHCTMHKDYLQAWERIDLLSDCNWGSLLSDHHVSVVISSTKEIGSHW